MFYNKIKLSTLLSFSLSIITAISLPTHAETLSEFSQSCATELNFQGPIPGFNCMDGVELPTEKFGNNCDAQAQLGGVGCIAGSRLGHLDLGNPDVVGIWICRKYSNYDTAQDDDFHDVAMIIHNKSTGKTESGKTCYFQNNLDSQSDGPQVPSPEAQNASTLWSSPQTTAGIGCATCHSNDPFLVTPHVSEAFAQFDLMDGATNPKGAYSVIGDDFQSFNSTVQNLRTEGCGGSCHYSAAGFWTSKLQSNALNVGWMPPIDDPSGIYRTRNLPQTADFNQGISVFMEPDPEYPGWRYRSGKTPTGNSYPTGPQTSSSTYIYVETSSNGGENPLYFEGGRANIQSQYVDITDATLSFDYYSYGSNIGHLSIDVWSKAFNNWMSIGHVSEVNEAAWKSKSEYLGFYSYIAGSPTKIRFRYDAAGGFQGDFAIDNVSITRD